ncbi:hypothetical protein Q8A73_022736 [Channa argus]|nr:hypothetical protein Q8A73_022736 [Channa argus]
MNDEILATKDVMCLHPVIQPTEMFKEHPKVFKSLVRGTKLVDTVPKMGCADYVHVATLLGCSMMRVDQYEVEDCRKKQQHAQQSVQGPIQILNRSSFHSQLKNLIDFSATQSSTAGC